MARATNHPMTPFQANVRRQRGALTRALNSGNPDNVIRAATRALASFDDLGFPDDWSRWQRALDDARFDAGRLA